MKPENAKVLVVDDTSSTREVMCEVLRGVGIGQVDEATNGAMALEKFLAGSYDVVVTDWYMPHATGLDLLKAIRRMPDRHATPVMVVTGEVTTRHVVEAIEAGATAFIAKPFVTPALPEKLLGIVAGLAPITETRPVLRVPATVSRRIGGALALYRTRFA